MEFKDIIKLSSFVMLSFGGGTVIVVALSSWLGNLWAKRILQNERAGIDSKIESLRHELGIRRSSYEHHLDLLLNYYDTFFVHYRRCQWAAEADAYKEEPNGEMIHTRKEFLSSIGGKRSRGISVVKFVVVTNRNLTKYIQTCNLLK